jgi:L-alanine-DL-glutamate epimerase-like enolase superfamily enzyme
MPSATIRTVEAFCYRYPLATPVVTSFGRMIDRPAVFVRITDSDGASGWGEVWCNFPSVGAEHRARLVTDLLGPLLVGREVGAAGGLYPKLSEEVAVLAIQTGEYGPLAQAIAGLDTAHWDLHARRAGQPLWRMLGGTSPEIRVYASGINPTGSAETAARALAAGHRAFKLKVGFDEEADLANIRAIRREVGELFLAVDANQAWTAEEASRRLPRLAEAVLGWLEEPIRADRPWSEWATLARAGVPLAAGENIVGEGGYEAAFRAKVLATVQPDLAKWGGISLSSRVARRIREEGLRFCPHYLGGGIGLLASAHLLAGIGGDGMLEVDINDNPLRNLCCGPAAQPREGKVALGEEPGLGFVPNLDVLAAWRTL